MFMLNMLSRFIPWVNHLTSNWLTSCTKKIAKSQGRIWCTDFFFSFKVLNFLNWTWWRGDWRAVCTVAAGYFIAQFCRRHLSCLKMHSYYAYIIQILLSHNKIIHPKFSKHWLSIVALPIDCVCSKILNHGLNHGLLFTVC